MAVVVTVVVIAVKQADDVWSNPRARAICLETTSTESVARVRSNKYDMRGTHNLRFAGGNISHVASALVAAPRDHTLLLHRSPMYVCSIAFLTLLGIF